MSENEGVGMNTCVHSALVHTHTTMPCHFRDHYPNIAALSLRLRSTSAGHCASTPTRIYSDLVL